MSDLGFKAIDEDDVRLYVKSNCGQDEYGSFSQAKLRGFKRPILIGIAGDAYRYEHSLFAMTIEEAKEYIKEMQLILDYLEE